ncbi:MAG: hypothetical protein ACT4O2_13440 [Beijerinckiaceae bacterium]
MAWLKLPGKRTTPPGKRTKISALDIVIAVGGILGIMAFNRMSIARLQRSLPNENSQIVGEWTSTRGPEHLVFRLDKSVSMIVPAKPAEGSTEPAATETSGPAPVTGKYVVAQGGKVAIQLMNGNKYTTTISPVNPNRFDLIDSMTDGVTTFQRTPAAPASTVTTPPEPPAGTTPPEPPTGTTPPEPSQ